MKYKIIGKTKNFKKSVYLECIVKDGMLPYNIADWQNIPLHGNTVSHGFGERYYCCELTSDIIDEIIKTIKITNKSEYFYLNNRFGYKYSNLYKNVHGKLESTKDNIIYEVETNSDIHLLNEIEINSESYKIIKTVYNNSDDCIKIFTDYVITEVEELSEELRESLDKLDKIRIKYSKKAQSLSREYDLFKERKRSIGVFKTAWLEIMNRNEIFEVEDYGLDEDRRIVE